MAWNIPSRTIMVLANAIQPTQPVTWFGPSYCVPPVLDEVGGSSADLDV
jgi:hypothetical protein